MHTDRYPRRRIYKTWLQLLQGIDPQPKGKPAYASYIGAKVAQRIKTGWVLSYAASPQILVAAAVGMSDIPN